MRARWVVPGRPGRGDEGPPDPATAALVAAVLPLVGSPGRWGLPALPGGGDHPGPGAPRGRRDRWWHAQVSAVGGMLLLVDLDVPHRAVRLAVELAAHCAVAAEDGVTDPEAVTRRLPDALRGARRAVWAHASPGAGGEPPRTALDAVRAVVALVQEAGLR